MRAKRSFLGVSFFVSFEFELSESEASENLVRLFEADVVLSVDVSILLSVCVGVRVCSVCCVFAACVMMCVTTIRETSLTNRKQQYN